MGSLGHNYLTCAHRGKKTHGPSLDGATGGSLGCLPAPATPRLIICISGTQVYMATRVQAPSLPAFLESQDKCPERPSIHSCKSGRGKHGWVQNKQRAGGRALGCRQQRSLLWSSTREGISQTSRHPGNCRFSCSLFCLTPRATFQTGASVSP